jgi:hypothetical protein
MAEFIELNSLPPELPLKGAFFYSAWGRAFNVKAGVKGSHEYVAFDYDSNSGETAHTETVVAIKTTSPKAPATSLSSASGLRLERVGDWIFAFEAGRWIRPAELDALLDDILNLLEYAKAFPQNV